MEIKTEYKGIGTEKTLDYEEIVKKDEKEKYNGSIWLEKKTFRIVLISIFSALAIVLGYALISLPNVELFTLMIFLGGFILGRRDGVIIGLISSFIYVFFNPWGTSPAPLFIYQIIHYCLTGLIGGVISNNLRKKESFKPKEDLYIFRIMLYLGLTGALITFIFDIVTTLIGVYAFQIFSLENLIAAYIIGIPYTMVHLIGNTLGFIFLLPGLINLTHKLLD